MEKRKCKSKDNETNRKRYKQESLMEEQIVTTIVLTADAILLMWVAYKSIFTWEGW